jgi:hypothetical protein
VPRNMQRYIANIPFTLSYWYRCSQDLSALILERDLFLFYTNFG